MRIFGRLFVFSLGMILFFFFLRFALMALVIAGALSLIFFVARTISGIFSRSWWEHGAYHRQYASREVPTWKYEMYAYPQESTDSNPSDYRTIKVM